MAYVVSQPTLTTTAVVSTGDRVSQPATPRINNLSRRFRVSDLPPIPRIVNLSRAFRHETFVVGDPANTSQWRVGYVADSVLPTVPYLQAGDLIVLVEVLSDKESVTKGGGEDVRTYSGNMRSTKRWIRPAWTARTLPMPASRAAALRSLFLAERVVFSGIMVRGTRICSVKFTEANAPFIDPDTGDWHPDGKAFDFTLTEV